MGRKRSYSHEVREDESVYGSSSATVVDMPAELLDVGVEFMKELKKKAQAASHALKKAGVSHAVIGGLALGAHLAKAHPLAERNTQDMDILLNRDDLERAKAALAPLGYRFRKVMRLSVFMPNRRGAHFVEGIHVIWASEKVRPEYPHPAPHLTSGARTQGHDGICYLSLPALVTMKLTSFRHKDITHIQDLLFWKVIDKRTEKALPADLRKRLRQVKRETQREYPG